MRHVRVARWLWNYALYPFSHCAEIARGPSEDEGRRMEAYNVQPPSKY